MFKRCSHTIIVFLVAAILHGAAFGSAFTPRLTANMAEESELPKDLILRFLTLIQVYDRCDLDESELMMSNGLALIPASHYQNLVLSFVGAVDRIVESKDFKTRADLAELETIYNNFLRVAFNMFPGSDLKSMYFWDPTTDRNILSLKGLKKVIDEHAKRETYKGLKNQVVYTTFDQIADVFSKLDREAVGKDGYQKIILMRHTLQGHEPHVTPVFVRFEGDEMRVLTTDVAGTPYDSSLYHTTYKEKMLFFPELIASQINPNGDYQHRVSFYVQKETRQFFDLCSCGMFSLKDILEYWKGDVWTFIDMLSAEGRTHELTDEERILPAPNLSYYVLDYLPSAFMRVHQSFRALETYVASTGKSSFVDAERLRHEIARWTLDLSDGKVNYYARYRFFKSSAQTIKCIFASSSKDPEEAL